MILQIHRAAELLFEPGQVVELRILNALRDGRHRGTVSGYFDNMEALVQSTSEYAAPAVYWTLNPVLPELLGRANNRVVEWCRTTTSDAEVVRRRWLPVDFDPVRPTGLSATEAEHAAALNRAAECRAALGHPCILADSGNGAHLLYRIDLPNSAESTELIRGFLAELSERYSDDTVTVDRKVYNAARIWKVYGTWARKGDEIGDRVWREASLVDVPEELPFFEIHENTPKIVKKSNGEFDVNAWLHSHNVTVRREKPWEGGRLWEVDCPWKPEDAVGKGSVILHPNGAVSFSCRHAKCEGRGWDEYRAAVAPIVATGETVTLPWLQGVKVVEAAGGGKVPPVPGEPELYVTQKKGRLVVQAARPAGPVPGGWTAKSPTSRTISWSCDTAATSGRNVDDPLRLAEIHLEKWGRDALTCFNGDTYRYSSEEGWVLTSEAELAPWIRETTQEEFDRAALDAPVTKALVSNVFLAMQQLVVRSVPLEAQAPFWLSSGPETSADALDLLCLKNGILDVRGAITGLTGHFMALTPKLFYEHQAAFAYDTGASAPVWQGFLESLKQPSELLQEIMGYTLWLGYDLDKIFLLHGPPRSGKSVITKVMTDLCGGPRAACSLDLRNFVSDFGLQNALGRRLIVVPESELPERGAAQIVAKLKAISGGDAIEVNKKYLNPVVTRLRGRIWMVTNSFVALPDSSGALTERLVPLGLTESFRDDPDLALPEKLEAEYPGILLWALEGARRLWSSGGRFSLLEASKERLAALRSESAPLSDFIVECLLIDSRYCVSKVGLYQIYLNWCRDEPMSERQFTLELRASIAQLSESRGPGEREQVVTPWDIQTGRPRLWLNVAPQPHTLQSLQVV